MTGTAGPGAAFAERYQSVLVPVIFEPWARELVRRGAPRPGEDILDLACGTGAVTREAAARRGGGGRLAAADHSAGMLEVARMQAEAQGLQAEWLEADAAALPFGDDAFDVAFCQQALQFFPDRPAALRELHRVLRPGGRAVFCVQRELEANPMLQAQEAALARHAGPEAAAAVRAICGLPDAEEILQLFAGAGFRDVALESVAMELHHPDAREFAAGAMGGMHTGDKLTGIGGERAAQAVDDFLAGLGPCFDGTGMRFPHVSHVIEARV
ncbi:class I SAM-dependent methyltransferase [Mangrovicoccus sp. HB161399]|uniref:class I SAM-dependent methyltransferase n=1 Tax=Mangrovicoccus sp. HB161399 TaxID=2720392 RepID=UPI001555CE57|nr:methyltransferase domain-containing protein [Mangrovicoccus sp. HB161399]